MEPPRLKIKEHEVGLRKVGDNLFEPKNEAILLQCLTGSLNLDNYNAQALFAKNEPPEESKTYKKIVLN